MAESKKKVEKKETGKKFWKIMSKDWSKAVLRPKAGTSDKVLKALKAKDGYTVEEA
tara:strand:+ start:1397 stop:1564 length:168 start_codon:yes stop_codon:yes gene_type:complete